MNNVLNSLIEESMKHGLKNLIDSLSELDAKELTENTAEIVNSLLKDYATMHVTEDGNVDLKIKLSADQIKFILKEISNQL